MNDRIKNRDEPDLKSPQETLQAGPGSTASEPSPASLLPQLLKIVLLILLTACAYAPGVNGDFIWDDDDYVTENPTLHDLDGLVDLWIRPSSTPQYYPLVFSTFWVEYQLWGLEATGFRVTNIALHAINALLIWRLLGVLGISGAYWAALIFAVHPVHIESVTWITERKNVLSGFFYLLAMLCYVRRRPFGFVPTTAAASRGYYALTLLLFVAALLSKSVTATLPAALLVILWMKKGELPIAELLKTLPFFALGIGFGLHTAWLEYSQVYAQGEEFQWTFWQRSLIASRSLWTYLVNLVAPVDLMFFYPKWNLESPSALTILSLPAWLLLCGVLLARAYQGHRRLLASLLLFAGTLFPALGFLNVYPHRYSFVADHFQYLASIPIIAVFGVCLHRLWETDASFRAHSGKRFVSVRKAIPIVVIAALVALSMTYVRVFDTSERIWRHVIANNPTCWIALNNLAVIESDRGNKQIARELSEAAIEHNPNYFLGHWTLGNICASIGDADCAVASFRAALDNLPSADYDQTDHHDIRIDIGTVLLRDDRTEEAIAAYRDAVRRFPDSQRAHAYLGDALRSTGRFREAHKVFESARQLDPTVPSFWKFSIECLFDARRYSDALPLAFAFQKRFPKLIEPYLLAAEACRSTGNETNRLQILSQTVQIFPADPRGQLALAWALATTPDETLRNSQRAAELARACHTRYAAQTWQCDDVLAASLAAQGNFSAATIAAERALAHPTLQDPEERSAVEARLNLYQNEQLFLDQPPQQ